MRLRASLTVAALVLLSACGGSGDSEATGPAAPPPGAAQGQPTPLLGMVGSQDDPEAYEITLTDVEGNKVERLPAGDYEIEVDDLATIHNFHLEGSGVNEATSVEKVEKTTFSVTLEPGEYTYDCDPHESTMNGSFQVV